MYVRTPSSINEDVSDTVSPKNLWLSFNRRENSVKTGQKNREYHPQFRLGRSPSRCGGASGLDNMIKDIDINIYIYKLSIDSIYN